MNELTVVQPQQVQQSSVFLDMESFENGQRMAKVLSNSQLVPEIFRGNIADCVIALELAMRIGASPMAVLQNTYIVHGKPGYSATFIIAMINTCGRYSPLRFEITGEDQKKVCYAWALELATSERLEGPPVSIEMAKAEGWYGKKGSKWQTMPDLMLRYRAATFFGRMYAPELLMGMRSTEELYDTGVSTNSNEQSNTSVEKLNQTFKSLPSEPVVEVATEQEKPKAKKEEVKPLPRDPKATLKLISAIAMIDSLETMEKWLSDADSVIKKLTHKDDQAEVRAFAEDHHSQLTEREASAQKDEPQEDYLSHIEGDAVVPHDPDVPYAHFQREARRQKTPERLDKWRMAKFQEFEKVMSDEELADFLNWVTLLYDHWTAEGES